VPPEAVEDEEAKAMRLHNAQRPQAYMLMFNVQK
jgi:hypothetical protein